MWRLLGDFHFHKFLAHNFSRIKALQVCTWCITKQTSEKVSQQNFVAWEDMSYKCAECEYMFFYEDHLEKHKITHNSNRTKQYSEFIYTSDVKCKICDFVSPHAATLNSHMMMHSGEKPHKCNQCDHSTNQASYLKKHKKQVTVKRSHTNVNSVTLHLNDQSI